MPSIGRRCHELRIQDENTTWRIVYRSDSDGIVIVDIFAKNTQKTPVAVIQKCKARLNVYDQVNKSGIET